MAYTIPTSADTPEQAILAVASAVKGEQVTGGDGSVNKALDILADALAGEDVEVPMTQQGAILALAQYVGGGGGVDVGAPWRDIIGLEEAPSVGDTLPSPHDTVMADYVMIGDAIVAGTAAVLAAGTTFVLTDEDVAPTLLLLTTNGIQDNEQVTAVEDISSIVSIIEIPDVSDSCVTFTMPNNPAPTKRLAIIWAD